MVVGNQGHAVTWVAILSFECNTITWEDDDLLYASKAEPQEGIYINKPSDIVANEVPAYDSFLAEFHCKQPAQGVDGAQD